MTKRGRRPKMRLSGRSLRLSLYLGDQVQSVKAPQTFEAKNRPYIVVVTAEEENEYSVYVEITLIVPFISEAMSTTPAPIVTEVNDEDEEAKDDEELKIPDPGADLGRDENDDDNDDDDFFIQHILSTYVKGISINEPQQREAL
ncbi:hypothetical protein L6452_05910 [Arctium lappa]|uniref:Uncharacterized protein n=1 Tax=Arctium lappa TaxID=4217 RepID=A0ACB9EI02_ARCLA|nr:hypothetical protein L6452_05910 [Arctium lappa]